MKRITMSAVRAGARAFHAEHNSRNVDRLDVIKEVGTPVYFKTMMHDFLHFFFDLSTKDEDLLSCIEARLDSKCTSLNYLSGYTDSLPVGFQDLWNTYCLS